MLLGPALAMIVWWVQIPADKPPTPSTPPSKEATRPPAKPGPTRPEPPPPVLEGSVRGPEGKAVRGARVRYRPLNARRAAASSEVKTDQDGRFRVVLTGRGEIAVQVEAAGYAPATFDRVRPGPPLAVTLSRGSAIEGLVQDSDGQPLAGARVWASGPYASFMRSAWDVKAPQAVTDGRGRFRVRGIGPGQHTLLAEALGHASGVRHGVPPGGSITFVLARGGGIAGRVTEASGRPARGTLVRARRDGPPAEESRTEPVDHRGHFILNGLSPGSYTIVARHPGFAPQVLAGVIVEAVGLTEAALVLEPGAVLTGRLMGPERRPTAGRIQLQELNGQFIGFLHEVFQAEAGPDGAFRIAGVPRGAHMLLATAKGFGARRVQADVGAHGEDLDLGEVLLEPGLAIRGRVRMVSGEPVGDADISAHPRDSGGFFQTQSEADGSFVIGGLEPGPFAVSVQATGFAPLHQLPATSGGEDLDLILSDGGSIAGKVLDDRGRPCPAYAVTAYPATAEGLWDEAGAQNVGDESGQFQLRDLPEGAYVLQVMAPEFAPASSAGVKVRPGETTDVGTIRLTRGGIVAGAVTDRTGAPVAGASVSLVADPGLEASIAMPYTATAGADGAFEIRGVPSGSRIVAADHPEYAEARAQVEVDPARGPAEVRLVLPRGGRIEGVVRGREGIAAADWHVRWSPLGDPFSRLDGAATSTTTGPDGAFAFDHVRAGTVQVMLSPATKVRFVGGMRRVLEVQEGETTRLEVTLREILVTGRVSRRGAPLGGAAVRFSQQGSVFTYRGPLLAASESGPQRLWAKTAGDGSFALIVDEAGTYRVRVEPHDGQPPLPAREVSVPDVEAHGVELTFDGVTLAGQVVEDGEPERPIANAYVAGRTPDGARALGAAQTGADGRFEIEAEAGDYVITASADGYAPARQNVTVGTGGGPDLRIELTKGLTITGRMISPSGQPATGVYLAARSARDESERPWPHLATALPDGSFRIQDLPPGAYNLCAGAPASGYSLKTGVSAGARDVALELRPTSLVRIRATLPDGSAPTDGYVSLNRIGGRPVYCVDNGVRRRLESGLVELSAPAGDLEIEIGDRKHEGTVRVAVGEGATAEAEVRLAARPDER